VLIRITRRGVTQRSTPEQGVELCEWAGVKNRSAEGGTRDQKRRCCSAGMECNGMETRRLIKSDKREIKSDKREVKRRLRGRKSQTQDYSPDPCIAFAKGAMSV
jgi:hypothetical protein